MGLMSTVTKIAGAAGSRRGAPGGRATTGLGGSGLGGRRAAGTTGAAGGREAQMAGGLLRKVLRKR